MSNRTILSAILDRVENCIREMLIPDLKADRDTYIPQMANCPPGQTPPQQPTKTPLGQHGYDLVRLGKPNIGYQTPLRACYRDIRDVEPLDRQFRIPSVFLLLDTGFFRGNQDQAPFSQENYPLDAFVTKFPVLLRTLLKKDSGQLVLSTGDDDAGDTYSYLTDAEWGELELAGAFDKSYKDPSLPEKFRNKLRKIPITDQISDLLADFDTLLNPYNLAGRHPEYPENVGVLDAFITSVECLQGILSPFEVVDYSLEITFWQRKGFGPVFSTGTPVVS